MLCYVCTAMLCVCSCLVCLQLRCVFAAVFCVCSCIREETSLTRQKIQAFNGAINCPDDRSGVRCGACQACMGPNNVWFASISRPSAKPLRRTQREPVNLPSVSDLPRVEFHNANFGKVKHCLIMIRNQQFLGWNLSQAMDVLYFVSNPTQYG